MTGRRIDPTALLKCVHATRGKCLRAEPVAAIYDQGKVKHVDPRLGGVPPDAKPASTFAGGTLEQLEDQMCDFGLDGLSSGASPDRLDALVWAITDLTTRAWQGPRIRRL